jgi:hypothetical protein
MIASLCAPIPHPWSNAMLPIAQYVGLDVPLEETKACVVDEAGRTLWRGSCPSTPDEIEELVCKQAPNAVRVGLETGAARFLHRRTVGSEVMGYCVENGVGLELASDGSCSVG